MKEFKIQALLSQIVRLIRLRHATNKELLLALKYVLCVQICDCAGPLLTVRYHLRK